MSRVPPPFYVFHDIDGTPVDAGYIYIGTYALNPVTNPITVYSDRALTIPVAQPIRTVAGLPVDNNGAPIVIYTSATQYSIIVNNKNGTLIRSDLTALNEAADAVSTFEQRLADTANGSPDAFHLVSYPKSDEEVTYGATIVNPEYKWGNLIRYGGDPTGVADSTSAWQTACGVANLQTGIGEVYKPQGKFKITPQTIYTGSIYYCINLASMSGIKVHGPGEILISMGGLRSTAFHLDGSDNIELGPTRFSIETTTVNQAGLCYSKNSTDVVIDGFDTIYTDANSSVEGIVIAETSNSRWTVKNCNLPTSVKWGSGIAFYDIVQDVHILDNKFSGGYLYYAIDIERKGATSENVLIRGNIIHDAPWTPIHSIADKTIIDSNVIDGVIAGVGVGADTWDCIRITDGHDCIISNNICLNAQDYGISVYRGDGATLANNRTSGNGLGGVYVWATNSGGTCSNVTIEADNVLLEDSPVVYDKVEKIINARDLRPEANNKIFDIGSMFDWGTAGVENPVFSSTLTTAVRATHAHQYGNTSLNFPASASGSQQLYLTFPAEFWTPLKGKFLIVTLNYDMDVSFTGNPRFRMQDGVNDWNINLPVQNTPKNQTFVFAINSAATQLILRLYMQFSAATTNNIYYNFMTIGSAQQDRAQKKFASAIPDIATYNGDEAMDPTATATPFKWVYSGGAWRVLV